MFRLTCSWLLVFSDRTPVNYATQIFLTAKVYLPAQPTAKGFSSRMGLPGGGTAPADGPYRR